MTGSTRSPQGKGQSSRGGRGYSEPGNLGVHHGSHSTCPLPRRRSGHSSSHSPRHFLFTTSQSLVNTNTRQLRSRPRSRDQCLGEKGRGPGQADCGRGQYRGLGEHHAEWRGRGGMCCRRDDDPRSCRGQLDVASVLNCSCCNLRTHRCQGEAEGGGASHARHCRQQIVTGHGQRRA